MLSNSTDKQLPENAVSTSCLPSVFQFSDNRDSESKSLTPHGSYAVYVPDLSYAISVQGLERFIQYREETYRWMLHVCTCGAEWRVDQRGPPLCARCGLHWNELLWPLSIQESDWHGERGAAVMVLSAPGFCYDEYPDVLLVCSRCRFVEWGVEGDLSDCCRYILTRVCLTDGEWSTERTWFSSFASYSVFIRRIAIARK